MTERVHVIACGVLAADLKAVTYKEQFAEFPGAYYISTGWVEEKARPQTTDDAGPGARKDEEFDRLVEAHGQENAEAIRYFLNSWQRNYQRAAFIDTAAGGS